MTREQISVESLKDVSVLYESDIYELACLLLKINDAKGRSTGTIYRQTVSGLASAYGILSHVEFEDVIRVLRQHNLPLGATVEHADSIAEPFSPPNRRGP